MRQVAENLTGIAAEVRIVNLPGLGEDRTLPTGSFTAATTQLFESGRRFPLYPAPTKGDGVHDEGAGALQIFSRP